MMRRLIPLALLFLVSGLLSPSTVSGQGADIDQLRAPRGPFDPSIPRPESVLGHVPGADFRLADWPTILEYLQVLDDSSDRIRLEEIGRTAEGQPMVLALISSPANLERADHYREISARLARARDLDENEARRLAEEGRAVVWIDSGLHATEVAHGQHAPELAWMMVAGESPEAQRIRDDVILLLMPNMNPDGLNIVVDWYERNLGTPYETAPLPVLYQKYTGHDNNRDWYMITQPETRAVARQLYEVWYPQIVYNHHQTAPFPARIFVPPFDEPANPNIPPLVLRGIARVGNAITSRLEAEDKPGAVSRLGFTAWWNGGMRTAPYFHNMVGILTETALFRYATPNFYPPDSLPDTFRDGTSTRQPGMKYPMPWPGGWWRLRDPIEYMLSASIATLDVGSRYRDEWLMNIWRMGRSAVDEGADGSPAAWLVKPEQHDAGAAAEMVNVLRRGGLEVHRADAEFTADGRTYPAGTFVVPADQAFRAYAVDMLEPQVYPDRRVYPGGPPDPPYDLSGWTLPMQMGVDVERAEAPFEASLEPLVEPARVAGRVLGDGNTYVLDPRSNNTAKAINRLLEAGAELYWAAEALEADGVRFPPGAVVVADEPGMAGRMASIAEEEDVVVHTARRSPEGAGWQLRQPRIALYEPWTASMDAGWTRFLFDNYGFPYTRLRDAEVRKGDLLESYDVIVLPSMSARAILEGHSESRMPEQYTGGIGASGLQALRTFVEQGGTLVALDSSTGLPIDRFGLPVRDALADLDQEEFFCPGSLLRVEVDNRHPVAYGMPREATAFFVRSSAFTLGEELEEDSVEVIARYPDRELLESGWIHGEEHLRGTSAVVEAELGAGRVVLIGFRAQLRAQPHETFKLLFNSLYYAAAWETQLP